MKYYHGGRPIKGQWILPPSVTGQASLASYGAAGVCSTERVYITSHLPTAVLYASGQKNGCVYQVIPFGPLVTDPDTKFSGLSWEVLKAKIVQRFPLTQAQLEETRRHLMEIMQTRKPVDHVAELTPLLDL